MSNKIKLISFADGSFSPRKKEFERQARNIDIFDDVTIYNRSTLDEEFRNNHIDFMLSNPRGFGYYIWKPQVVRQELINANENDLVCYMDVGYTFNKNARYRFLEYIQLAYESRWKMLSFSNIHTEYKWTKADLAKKLSVHDSIEVMGTSQLSSGFFILSLTQSNLELIDAWAKIAVEDNYHYSNDEPSIAPNHLMFKEHRHDQSIFSLLRKIRGTTSTFYEVQAYAGYFKQHKNEFPAWATRSRK